MARNDIVADIKIKEQNGNYYHDLDSYKNIPINKLIALLKMKYGESLVTKIDKILEKSTFGVESTKTCDAREEPLE